MARLGHGINECVLMTCLGHADSLRLTRKLKLETTWWKSKYDFKKTYIYIYLTYLSLASALALGNVFSFGLSRPRRQFKIKTTWSKNEILKFFSELNLEYIYGPTRQWYWRISFYVCLFIGVCFFKPPRR